MGVCASAPKTVETKEVGQTAEKQKQNPSYDNSTEEGIPDPGLEKDFQFVKFLGRGGTGDTYLYKNRATGEDVAIKLVPRPIPKILLANILREIRIQAELGEGHNNVVEAKEAILTDKHLALVMEYAAGGSMTNYVAEHWQTAQATGLFLDEDECRYFFRQFIRAVEFCHQHCVAHRDLKLDNTLLDSSNPPVIKLCDFGFAKTWTEDANMYTHIGTPVYMSPELISSRNGAKPYDGTMVDIWASGILLIVMLLGTFPFDHFENPDPNTTEAHVEVWLQQVRRRWNEVPHIKASVAKLSPECQDLLNRMFVVDTSKRIHIDEIKSHPWVMAPLQPKYQAAEDALLARQEKLTAKFEERKLNLVALKARNEKLSSMIQQAGTRSTGPGDHPGPSHPPSRIIQVDLSDQAVVEHAAETIAEHPEEGRDLPSREASGDGAAGADPLLFHERKPRQSRLEELMQEMSAMHEEATKNTSQQAAQPGEGAQAVGRVP